MTDDADVPEHNDKIYLIISYFNRKGLFLLELDRNCQFRQHLPKLPEIFSHEHRGRIRYKIMHAIYTTMPLKGSHLCMLSEQPRCHQQPIEVVHHEYPVLQVYCVDLVLELASERWGVSIRGCGKYDLAEEFE